MKARSPTPLENGWQCARPFRPEHDVWTHQSGAVLVLDLTQRPIPATLDGEPLGEFRSLGLAMLAAELGIRWRV